MNIQFQNSAPARGTVAELTAAPDIEVRYASVRVADFSPEPDGDYTLNLLHVQRPDADKIPLVFFPGPPANHHTMLYFARRGALLGHRVIVPDLSGFGDSTGGGVQHATMENYVAREIPAVVDAAAAAAGGPVFLGGVCAAGGFCFSTMAVLAAKAAYGNPHARRTLDNIAGLISISFPFDYTREKYFHPIWDMFSLLWPRNREVYFTHLFGKFEAMADKSNKDTELSAYIRHNRSHGMSDVPVAVIRTYDPIFKHAKLSVHGVDCPAQIPRISGQWGKPILCVTGRGDGMFSYYALRALPRELHHAQYKDFVYLVINGMPHVPSVGSKCDALWEDVLDPWITLRPAGELHLDKLLHTRPAAVRRRSGNYV